jgi:hypothetical protein
MSTLRLEIAGDRFRPGERVAGGAAWDLASPPKAVEVRLFWRTEGKGTVDVEVVDRVRFDGPAARQAEKFEFNLPPSPYSFSGKLISLLWGVELVVQPDGPSERASFTLSPTGGEILIREMP